MTETTAIPRLSPRIVEGHKGTFGRVLVVAGSRGLSGAAVLCGMASIKSGAGLVTVACPGLIQDVVSSGFPCYTTAGLPCDENGRLTVASTDSVLKLSQTSDVIAVGPGLGNSDGVANVVRTLLANSDKTLVLDADALNVLAPYNSARIPPTILTPHPGEFSRLTGNVTPTESASRRNVALAFAKEHRVVLLLKGHRTIVTDGERYFINCTGNPGMATGGSGDVLTGLIAALVGQGLSPFDACCLGAHLHGLAGDLAAREFGEVSMTALDLLNQIPKAFSS